MGCGTSFVKYVLFFFNFLVALLGLAVIGVGVAFLLNWSVIKDELKSHITVAPWVFIVIGAVMFIIAFFGCCGAIRESHCMIVTYAVFLLVIIIVQVVIAVLMFTYGDTIKDGLVKTVNSLYAKRSGSDVDKASEAIFSNLEQQMQCCGLNGPGDYGVLTRPKSCCRGDGFITGVCTDIDVYSTGCATRLVEFYDKWSKPIAGAAIGIACIEVVGVLFALCLANSIRNMDRRSRY